MHIFFSGIGGTGLGPLAMIARQAGYEISGSDKQDSSYIHYLQEQGLTNIHIGQTADQLAKVHETNPIDWFVYSSAVAIESPNAPELRFCRDNNIRMSKRDELLGHVINEKQLKLIAIAGTHGKTTTTAMSIWLASQLQLPASYSVGAKISFGDMGHYEPGSEYFIYEADEFDRNFLAFKPYISIITGVDWDHPDIYPTQGDYDAAFKQFIGQSQRTVVWTEDADKLGLTPGEQATILAKDDPAITSALSLPGIVNREDAWQVATAFRTLTDKPLEELVGYLNKFPGVSRRFERLGPHLITDYAHTPPKIRGTLETAHELAGNNVVVIYEGLHNTRQHFIKNDLRTLFDSVKQLYIVPSYLAREDPYLPLLSPEDLKGLLDARTQAKTTPMQLDDSLSQAIKAHIAAGDLVVCISAGGGGSLDEWLHTQF